MKETTFLRLLSRKQKESVQEKPPTEHMRNTWSVLSGSESAAQSKE